MNGKEFEKVVVCGVLPLRGAGAHVGKPSPVPVRSKRWRAPHSTIPYHGVYCLRLRFDSSGNRFADRHDVYAVQNAVRDGKDTVSLLS
jgi:hypothetical protein